MSNDPKPTHTSTGPIRPAKLTPAENQLLNDTLGTEEPSDSTPTDQANRYPSSRSVLYAWQMYVDEKREWNIIGMQMQPGGQALPLVTSSIEIAWQALELAQAHANRANTRCRLASFVYDTDLAIVDPEPEGET